MCLCKSVYMYVCVVTSSSRSTESRSPITASPKIMPTNATIQGKTPVMFLSLSSPSKWNATIDGNGCYSASGQIVRHKQRCSSIGWQEYTVVCENKSQYPALFKHWKPAPSHNSACKELFQPNTAQYG